MPTPKSVIKIKKDNVEYVSNVDAAEYYLFELTRAALRDVGKFIRKEWQKEYYGYFKKHTGAGGKSTTFKVASGANTKYPRVQIGLPSGKVDGFYSYFQEFGSSRTPRLGLLSKCVEGNIAEIVKIESQYLSALSEEAERLEALVDDSIEYEGGFDD